MSSPIRNRFVRQADEFLQAAKSTPWGVPQWTPSSWPREVQAIWRIQEASGIERAHLRFRCGTYRREYPSVTLIFRDEAIWRVDLVPESECKPNPHWAAHGGVPPRVCGHHEHAWPDNRAHLLAGAPWGLPCRRPLPANVRRLPQVLPWFAERIGLTLCEGWHAFDVPPQTDLFPR